MRALAGLIVVACSCVAQTSWAGDPPVPDFARNKPRVDDVETKEQGGFFSGLPLLGYDPSTQLGLGLGGYYTVNGSKTDPFFAITPYRHRIFVQGYATTGGYQQHMISYDGIYIGNSPYRVRATVMFERNTNANYFGVGTRTLSDLSFQGKRYSTYDGATAAASAMGPYAFASPNYFHYEYDRPSANVTLERDFWGGRVRAQYGFMAQYSSISTYDWTQTQGLDSNGVGFPATHGPTLLHKDCDRGLVVGCTGGWNNGLKAGIAVDTRDFEPDPTKGFFVDATGEWVSKGFGSAFDYLRLTSAARAYWSPFPKVTNLVLALRVVYSMQTSGVPFYSMDTVGLTEGDQSGVGGERTLRGYRTDRFVGDAMLVGNAELRWTFVHFNLLKQRFSIQIAPLFDIGTLFDITTPSANNEPSGLARWKVSGGAGLRIGWNRSTIIMFDLAASTEDVGFYIDFGMPF